MSTVLGRKNSITFFWPDFATNISSFRCLPTHCPNSHHFVQHCFHITSSITINFAPLSTFSFVVSGSSDIILKRANFCCGCHWFKNDPFLFWMFPVSTFQHSLIHHWGFKSTSPSTALREKRKIYGTCFLKYCSWISKNSDFNFQK